VNATITALIVFGCLVGAVLIGRTFRGLLPEAHLSAESKDAMKLAIGLLATVSALVLGLLVSSAKGAYDAERSEVILMASKITFLGRVLDAYGPEAADVRALLRNTADEAIQKMWPEETRRPVQLAPDAQAGNVVYGVLQSLSPHDDA
jgi:maleate cis-trans isomerase